MSRRPRGIHARLCRFTHGAVTAIVLAGRIATAQPVQPDATPLFDDARIPTITIEIAPDALGRILDPANPDRDVEEMARFTFDDGSIREAVDSVGFRLRGNTSRFSQKKSFKVSFNTFVAGRDFHGLEKLNLNGEHNDPSIVRSKLSWDLFAAMGVPASRANHVRLVVNGTYYGLYMNVEHVDERFLASRFGRGAGFLYKCLWPADLAYLGDGPGPYLPDAGRRPYDLKLRDSDAEGYRDLAHFIDVLNNSSEADFPKAIERVFNVNGFLKMLAVNVIVGMWDDYWFNKNNFYLYNDPVTGVFEFIPFDYDNTFGIWWDGILPGTDWGTRDVYAWGHPFEARPLTTRLFRVPDFRDRYTFYLRRFLDGPFETTSLLERAGHLHAMITPAAEADLYRTLDYGWDAAAFHASYTTALGDHVTYGLSEYVATRSATALGRLDDVDVVPLLSYVRYALDADGATFTALVEDEAAPAAVRLVYQPDGAPARTLPMYDDGAHGDREAGDGVYGVLVTERADAFRFHVEAEDVAGQVRTSPAQQVGGFVAEGPLYINEIMADNATAWPDEHDEFDDWVELYNAGAAPASLAGLYLSDEASRPDRWPLPAVAVPAKGFLILWLDNDEEQGALHGPFRLDRQGEQVGLYRMAATSFEAVDVVVFGEQEADVSYGRRADGDATFVSFASPTPGASNGASTAVEEQGVPAPIDGLSVYPNPVAGDADMVFTLTAPGTVRLIVFDVLGRRVAVPAQGPFAPGTHTFRWDGSAASGARLSPGLYVIRLEVAGAGRTAPAISTTPVVLLR